MLLNKWNHWLFAVGCMLLGFTVSIAQNAQKPVSELDALPTWYPFSQPVSPVFQPNSAVNPYAYASFSELVSKAKEGNKIEALTIDSNLLKRGGIASLSQLRGVRVLAINLSDLVPQQTDSLFQIIQDWPALERLTFSVNPPVFTSNEPISLAAFPISFQRFQKLHEVRLFGNGLQWDKSLKALASLKTLRTLEINSLRLSNFQDITIGPLSQLIKLRITGQSLVIKPGLFTGLDKLSELILTGVKIDTATFQRSLMSLPRLEKLELTNIQFVRKLSLSGLKLLKSVELTNNPDLSIAAAAFAGLPNLERLAIRSQSAVDLSELCSLTQLRTLQISGNGKPAQMPDCIDQLNQLTELRIENMMLKQLPNRLGDLSRLQKLSLTNCGIDTLSSVLGQLTNLQELNLMNNKLRQLPAISQLRSLRDLNVSGNQLTTLPDNIGQLTQLITLAAYGNKLTQLPASISRLVHLQTLSLQGNQLGRLPEELGELRKLQFLSLNNNQLTELPKSTGKLDSLQKLLIGNNRLKKLPDNLSRLKNLTELYITTNELTSLPADIGGLTKLIRFQISQNPITELPASICDLKNLKFLSIMGTQVRLLPENIGNLTRLQFVDLANNELIALPTSIGQWQELMSLRLDRNRLEGLPNSIGRLTKLDNIKISGKENVMEGATGGLQQLPDSIVYCTGLWELTIEQQPQLDVNDVFAKAAQLKGLIQLKLTNCNISRLPAIAWSTVPWQMLILSQNLLTELPVDLLEAPMLQHVSVQGNRLPELLDRDFLDKDGLRVGFVESGLLPQESLPKPSRKVSGAYQRLSTQKARQRDWVGALSDLDKAVDYAPDTIRAYSYAQRANLHLFRKEYPDALADFDKAIQYAPQLRNDKFMDTLAANRMLATYWQQKATVLRTTGQFDAALVAITQAARWLSPLEKTPIAGLVFTERGRYLTMKEQLAEADSSYRKAIWAYEKLPHAEPGVRLTVIELSLLTGQYDQAQRAITSLPAEQIRDGYATLKEYLASCLDVLNGEKNSGQAMDRLTAYLDKHPAKIYGWSFDLFDNWLTKTKLPAEKVTALRQLTDATKARLAKPE